jgi:hypothetical protein
MLKNGIHLGNSFIINIATSLVFPPYSYPFIRRLLLAAVTSTAPEFFMGTGGRFCFDSTTFNGMLIT